ncbi:MAG: hypothetical protein O7B25_05950 [Gammaproteobacteria bacterium]|nr:hypothetical protein [Gammaproteobacteria bacterium]
MFFSSDDLMLAAPALSYLVAGFVGAVILVYFVLRSVHAWNLVASVHGSRLRASVAPTSGGIGFAIPVAVYLALLAGDDLVRAGGLLAGFCVLLAVALWDDIRRLNWRYRLGGQIVSVAVIAWWLQNSSTDSHWHWLLTLGVGAVMLWQVRSFHLMDEVDGMAAVQCLLFCVAAQVLTLGIPGWVGELTWLLAGTVLGILIYNWPPAKIFMGSVGSALLGLLLAVLSVQLWRSARLPLITCLILLSGFWFNAIYALYVRMLTTRSFSQAHRTHLYRSVAERKGQIWALAAYAAFGICWLMPLAWLSVNYAKLSFLWLVLAILPMAVAARFLNAGVPPPDEG